MEDKCMLGRLKVYSKREGEGGGVAPLSLRKAQQDNSRIGLKIQRKQPTTGER